MMTMNKQSKNRRGGGWIGFTLESNNDRHQHSDKADRYDAERMFFQFAWHQQTCITSSGAMHV